jgi:hypothetical protein
MKSLYGILQLEPFVERLAAVQICEKYGQGSMVILYSICKRGVWRRCTVLEAHLLYVDLYCLSLLLPTSKRPRSSPRTSCSNFCTRICTLKNILKLTAHCTSYECGGRVFGANPRLGKIGVDFYFRLKLPPGNACLDVRHKGEFDNRAN